VGLSFWCRRPTLGHSRVKEPPGTADGLFLACGLREFFRIRSRSAETMPVKPRIEAAIPVRRARHAHRASGSRRARLLVSTCAWPSATLALCTAKFSVYLCEHPSVSFLLAFACKTARTCGLRRVSLPMSQGYMEGAYGSRGSSWCLAWRRSGHYRVAAGCVASIKGNEHLNGSRGFLGGTMPERARRSGLHHEAISLATSTAAPKASSHRCDLVSRGRGHGRRRMGYEFKFGRGWVPPNQVHRRSSSARSAATPARCEVHILIDLRVQRCAP